MRRPVFAPSRALPLLLVLSACSSPSTTDPSKTSDPVTNQTSVAAHDATSPSVALDATRRADDRIDQMMTYTELEAEGGVAYFAGGCFWGVEHFMEQIDGVLSVESGYMGGHIDNPSYEQVSSQTSGHLETVRVWFDPKTVSYAVIAKRFFEIHDPTQANGQGPDIGPEYLSAVFVTSDEQRAATEELIRRLRDRGFDVVTEIKPAGEFWIAEDCIYSIYSHSSFFTDLFWLKTLE